MSSFAFTSFVVFLTLVLVGLLFSPVVNFLWGGTVRRESILNTFSERSIELYFGMFAPGDSTSTSARSPRSRLTALYKLRYGVHRYIGPGVMLLGVAGISIFWSLFTAAAMVFERPPSAALPLLPPVAMLAVAGEYMWVVSDLQQRFRASDLGWQKLNEGCLRFVIAVPAAYAFGALANDVAALPVAFLLGAFPTKTIMKFARRAFRGQLKMEETAAAGQRSVNTLQGIDVPVAERFEDEAITSITQLAYSDVIDLTMRTGYTFSFVVDCSSQALAWLYFEENLKKVRIYGLRGAQEIGNLMDAVQQGDAEAKAVLKKAAVEVAVDEITFEHTLYEIAHDPYTEFLRNIWQTAAAAESDVQIFALMPDPHGIDKDNEIAVLANAGERDVLLDGWTLSNSRGLTFDLSGTIAAGKRHEFKIMCGRPFLRNTGDEITLFRSDGSKASFATYLSEDVVEGKYVNFEDDGE